MLSTNKQQTKCIYENGVIPIRYILGILIGKADLFICLQFECSFAFDSFGSGISAEHFYSNYLLLLFHIVFFRLRRYSLYFYFITGWSWYAVCIVRFRVSCKRRNVFFVVFPLFKTKSKRYMNVVFALRMNSHAYDAVNEDSVCMRMCDVRNKWIAMVLCVNKYVFSI